MMQAALMNGPSFDVLSRLQDCVPPSEVDVCRGQIIDAFVVASVIVMLDECLDLGFKIAG